MITSGRLRLGVLGEGNVDGVDLLLVLSARLRCLQIGGLGLLRPNILIPVPVAELSGRKSKIDALLRLELLVAVPFDADAVVGALRCGLLLRLLHSRLLCRSWIYNNESSQSASV